MKIPKLSKSRYMAGLQCHLRLWYECFNRDLASETDPIRQAMFDTGHEVGRLATELYPGGVRIEEDHFHHEDAVRSTLEVLKNRDVPALYEAAFLEDGVRIRVDVLQRVNGNAWNLIEVKSSTKVKKEHVPDVAVQLHVLQSAGLSVSLAGIMHINNQYVYDGKNLDRNSFLTFSDQTEEALSQQGVIPSQLATLKDMLGKKVPPDILPSPHCKKPYLCNFWEHCTQAMPEYWVVNEKGISAKIQNELTAMGIEDIRDIPADFPLSAIQQMRRDCVVNQKEYIAPGLREELMKSEYPIHFLDFETIGPAVPKYGGTRPYQTVPFQWSNHVMHENGNLEHQEYLFLEDKDPREEFAETLLEALGEKGSIVVYTTYEKGVLEGLAEYLPHYRDRLLAVIDRLYDLHVVVKNHYYHPEFHGSFSLKAVLPAVVPSMAYEKLEIQEGQMASLEYLRMIDPATSEEDREKIKKDLLEYCAQDTLAMVKIRDELLGRS
jgi:predicted RecB family nuclease